jgi:hypothetical protein
MGIQWEPKLNPIHTAPRRTADRRHGSSILQKNIQTLPSGSPKENSVMLYQSVSQIMALPGIKGFKQPFPFLAWNYSRLS